MVLAYRSLSTMPKAAKEKPLWGKRIAARRAELDRLSLVDIENRTEGKLYQALMYRLENGKKDPATLTLEQFDLLLGVLQWSLVDWKRETGLEAPGLRSNELVAEPDRAILPNMKRVPLLTAVAGLPVTGTFDIPAHLARPGTVVAVPEGDSMAPGLSEGDFALVDTSLNRLQEGRVYLFSIPGDGHSIKRVYRNGKGWEIHGDNRAVFKPQPLPEDWTIIGQVYDALRSTGFR